MVKVLAREHAKRQGEKVTATATTIKGEDATRAFSTGQGPHKCTNCGKIGHTMDRCQTKQKRKVEKPDAAAVAMYAGKIVSSGDIIKMIPTATIE